MKETDKKPKVRLLVANDCQLDRQAFEQCVARNSLPYQYTLAPSIAEARKTLIEGAFDVILLDSCLDDGSAFELLQEVKNTPVVMIVGVGEEQTAIRAMKAGAYGCLVKNDTGSFITALPVTVECVLARKRSEDALKRHQDQLQTSIEERTTQLRAANQQLMAEIARREQVDSTLRESEDKYRNLVERANDGVVIIQDGICRYVNPSLAEMAGLSIEQVIDTPFAQHVHPDHVQQVLDRYHRRMAGQPVESVYETQLLRKDGSTLYVELSAGIINYKGESADLVIVRDITERKRFEEALLESESRYRAIVEDQTELICRWKPDRRLTFVNEAYCRYYGKTREELLGSDWMENVEVQDRERVRQEIDGFLANLAPDSMALVHELRELSAGGEYRWLRWIERGIFDENETLTCLQSVGRDITENRAFEEALAAERNLLRTLIDNVPDIIFVKDTQGRFIVANIAHAKLLGLESPREIIGKTDFDVAPQELANGYLADDKTIIESGEPLLSKEETVVDSEGNTMWQLTTKVPLLDEKGNLTGVIGIGRDITEYKRVVQERESLQAQFLQSQKMEAMGRLTAGVAHDFNNLLTAINGFAQLSLNTLSPDEKAHEYSNKILASGKRAAELVRQLLLFSRKRVVETKILSLNDLMSDIDVMLRGIIGENVILETVLAPDLWSVRADRTRIEQVIVNLAVNARDAMPDGGRLGIETSNIELCEKYAASHLGVEPGEYVVLAVSDTGIGMTEEVKSHLFEPFYTTKAEGRGTGLGLATVYGIVQQHEGHIWVYSEPGLGSTFKVYLPRVKSANTDSTTTEIGIPTVGGTDTILVVEDDPTVRDLASGVLKSNGYNVLEAASAREAVQIASQHGGAIHLLLADVIIPGASGRAVADKLASFFPDLAVLYMSGYTDEQLKDHGLPGSHTAFLQKPFSPTTLVNKVRQILDS